MNDQFDNNESEVIQPNIDNTVNDVVTPEPVREAPRKARSVSSEPEEVTSSPKTVRPAARRSTPRARRMSLSLTRVDLHYRSGDFHHSGHHYCVDLQRGQLAGRWRARHPRR